MKPLDFSHSFLGAMPWSDRGAFLLARLPYNSLCKVQGIAGRSCSANHACWVRSCPPLFAWDSKVPLFASASDLRLAGSSIAGK